MKHMDAVYPYSSITLKGKVATQNKNPFKKKIHKVSLESGSLFIYKHIFSFSVICNWVIIVCIM